MPLPPGMPARPHVVPPSTRRPPRPLTQSLRLDRVIMPVHGSGEHEPPPADFGREPKAGMTVGDRYLVREEVGRLGKALLARATDLDAGPPVLLLVAPFDQAPRLPVGDREVTVPRPPRSSRLLRAEEVGAWDGLRFCVFADDSGVGLDQLLAEAGGTLPPLHLSLLAAQGCVALGAMHEAGWLLGGVWGASIRVNPWSMEMRMLGWGVPSTPGAQFHQRARAELRAMGRLLMNTALKRWGVGSELKRLSPERDLMDLLGLLASKEESTFLPGASDLAAAFGSVAATLR